MRAVGENPEAADTLGINVYKIRYFGVLMSGVFASLAGAFLSVGELGRFVENMIHGRGFIALAAMILGNWNPVGAMWAAILFGAAEAMNLQLQSSSIVSVSAGVKPLFNMIPFVVTLIVVGGLLARRDHLLLREHLRKRILITKTRGLSGPLVLHKSQSLLKSVQSLVSTEKKDNINKFWPFIGRC
jgi:ABC-type uncharacterized transport system permease subunit